METIDTSGRGTSGRCWQTELDPSPCAARRSADVGAPHSPPQACPSTRTARPARPEQTKSARSSRQFSRFCYAKNPDKVFGTHTGQLERYDCEYRRNGTVNLFVFLDAHRPWRRVKVTDRRANQDFAECMRELVDIDYPDVPIVRVVMDNLSTHSPS